ncbi:hypothetical protein LXL04_015606 [Taraxacum kok-saghyz]
MDPARASTSDTPPPIDDTQYPPEPLTDRVLRALENRLRLIHRSNNHFSILGATGNVYTVTLSASPSCTCPDSTTPCKHILFVYIRLLSVSLDDPCLWRRALRPCQLNRLLSAPVSSDAVAGAAIRQRYKELYLHRATTNTGEVAPPVQVEEGSTCPVCLEEMGTGDRKLVACESCKNPIHEECFMAWKRSSRRRSTSCVICRARWRDPAEQRRWLEIRNFLWERDESRKKINVQKVVSRKVTFFFLTAILYTTSQKVENQNN